MFGKGELPRRFIWKPREDITAYEIALCMSVLIASIQRHSSASLVDKVYSDLPEMAKRHFEVDAEQEAA